jgi:hypothetical protein
MINKQTMSKKSKKNICKTIAMCLLTTQGQSQNIPNSYPLPSTNSYPFKLLGSQQVMHSTDLQNQGYSTRNAQGSKVYISFLYKLNEPIEFHRAIAANIG